MAVPATLGPVAVIGPGPLGRGKAPVFAAEGRRRCERRPRRFGAP